MTVNNPLQQVTAEQAYEAICKRLPEEKVWLTIDCLEYWAYPQAFGSTTGPFGGVGGQMVTTFTIEAWVSTKIAVLFCGDKILKVTDKWTGPLSVRL